MAAKKKTQTNNKGPSPFDFINSINNKDNYELIESEEKAYNPFIINKSLSHFNECIFYANEMNKYNGIDNKLQYDFYYYLLPKRKRFSKWMKSSISDRDQEILGMIREKYHCSGKEAQHMLSLFQHNNNELEKLKSGVYKGGKSKQK